MPKIGRPFADERRENYCKTLGVSAHLLRKDLVPLEQLDKCADDEARRILLGIGRQA